MGDDGKAGLGPRVLVRWLIGDDQCRTWMHQRTHALRGIGREADAIHGLRGEKRRKRNCVCSGGQAYRQPFEMTRICVRPCQSKGVSAERLLSLIHI